MLIPSKRHSKDDITVWKEQEKADAAQARSAMLWRNYQRCKVYLAEAKEKGGYIGVSWGKDSVVLAHMASVVCPEIPLVWIKVSPIFNPDCEAIRDAYLNAHVNQRYCEIDTHCRWDGKEWHASGTLEDGIKEAKRLYGDHAITGVRAEESSTRSLRVWTYGVNTKRTSAPLAYLTAQSIFAILHAYKLPVHPAYAMNGGGRWSRQHLRVASLGGRRGDGHGRHEWEREYYGDVLARLDAMQVTNED